MELTLTFFCIIGVIIAVGIKKNINFGILGIVAALGIALFICGETVTESITKNFPVSLFFNLFITTLFYGFANKAGVMRNVAQRIIYANRSRSKWFPLIGYAMCILISAMGPGAMSPLICSALMFSLAAQVGFHPALASYAVWAGAMIGDSMPWMATFHVQIGTFQAILGEEYLPQIENGAKMRGIWFFIIFTLAYIIFYFLLGANKISNAGVSIEPPKPFSREEKISLVVVACVISLQILPDIINLLMPNPITAWIIRRIPIQLTATVGTVILVICHIADFNDVLKNEIPWSMIVTVCGMMYFMKYAASMNVVDVLSRPLQGNIPAWLLPAALVLIMGILSYFCDGRAVAPIIQPLYPVFVALGCSVESVMIAQFLGGAGVSLSPFSTGGAMALNGCPDELREKTVRTQLVLPWFILAIVLVFAVLGTFNFGNIPC